MEGAKQGVRIGETKAWRRRAARGMLRLLAVVLILVSRGLRRIPSLLPPSCQEMDPEIDLVGETDVRSEVRRVVQCVVVDFIEPAIAALTAAARYQPCRR